MSNLSSYNSMWERVIRRAILNCYNQVDERFKKETELRYIDLSEYKKELESLYKRKREWLKDKYLPNEEEPLLDFHKLSAIMCRCVIGNKPFDFNVEKAREIFDEISNSDKILQDDKIKWEIDNVYINYKLAFFVGEGIVFDDLLFWATEKTNAVKLELENKPDDEKNKNKLFIYNSFVKKLKENRGLYSYATSSSHDDFVTSVIIALMKTDFLKRDFDYLQFSTNMFQWQEYTKKQYLYDIIFENKLSNFSLEDLV